ncbi:MAG: hypothetical protein NTW06_00915, partial [Candidatus Falkowbacteria bacterium]|nr:hypothetical protein [Candidatus Falkowbacteria bacterium]
SKINKNKKLLLTLSFIVGIGLFFIAINAVYAQPVQDTTQGTWATIGSFGMSGVGGAVAMVVGVIAYLITAVVGLLITLIIKILISVAQFNNIINVDTVSKGWIIVRDLCNMFFILILLVIAFATILRIESYNLKKTLPKLLIMAVLINFSKTICGLLIDLSQVIMLTFANGFSNGSGWFIDMFRTQYISKLSLTASKDTAFNNWSVAVASIGGVIAAIITLIVLVVMLAVLVMRIIMLWIYVILSPFAFLAAAFPAGQKYSSQWWSEFSKQLIVGPALAFFIWLALTTVKGSSEKLMPNQVSDLCAGINAFFCNVDFQRFILAIGFLIGGLMITQQMGGIAASIAGKGMNWAKKAPLALGKSAMFAGAWGARKFAASKYGFQANPFQIVRGIREGLKDKKAKDMLAGEKRSKELLEKGGVRGLFGGLGAGKDWTNSYVNGIMNWRGFRQMGRTLTHGTGYRDKKFKEKEALVEQKKAYQDVYGSQEEKDLALKKLGQKKSKITELNDKESDLQAEMDLAGGDNKKRMELFKQKEQIRKQREALGKEINNEENGYVDKDGKRVKGINERGIDPEKKLINQKIKGIDRDLRTYMAPRGFEGRAAMRQLVGEEKKKIADVKLDGYARRRGLISAK